MKKVLWADMTDDDDDQLAIPVSISKHGIKIKKHVPSTDKIKGDHKSKDELRSMLRDVQ